MFLGVKFRNSSFAFYRNLSKIWKEKEWKKCLKEKKEKGGKGESETKTHTHDPPNPSMLIGLGLGLGLCLELWLGLGLINVLFNKNDFLD